MLLQQARYPLVFPEPHPWEADDEVAVQLRTGWATVIVEQGQTATFQEDGRLGAGFNSQS